MPVESFEGPVTPYPVGSIMMWTGALQDIPEGWVVCDGNNGAPDLRDRFPKSVPDTSTDPGATGGQDSFTMSSSQLPSHSHTASGIDTQSDHTHKPTGGDRAEYADTNKAFDCAGTEYPDSADSNSSGAHSHSITLESSGGSSSIENRPPYHEVVFIQKA